MHRINGFWYFQKNRWIKKKKKKSDKFGTKYLKSDVNIVIPKMVYPHPTPNFTPNFQTHTKKKLTKFELIFSKYTTYFSKCFKRKKIKGYFWYFVPSINPSHPCNPRLGRLLVVGLSLDPKGKKMIFGRVTLVKLFRPAVLLVTIFYFPICVGP